MRQDSEFFYWEGPREKFDRSLKVAKYYALQLKKEMQKEKPNQNEIGNMTSVTAAYFMIASIADRARKN